VGVNNLFRMQLPNSLKKDSCLVQMRILWNQHQTIECALLINKLRDKLEAL